jgi:hypothetical protein
MPNLNDGILTLAVQKETMFDFQGILFLLKAPSTGCLIEMKKVPFIGANDLRLFEITNDQIVSSNAPMTWSPSYFLLEGWQPFEEWKRLNNPESFLGRFCVATTTPFFWGFEVK